MLEKIRKDRPNQVIHEVLGFEKNDLGFYDVRVDMEIESSIFTPKPLHHNIKLAYPVSSYLALSESEQRNYRFDSIIF